MSRYYHAPMTREEIKAANSAAIKALTSRGDPRAPRPVADIPKDFLPIYNFVMQEIEKDQIAAEEEEEERRRADDAKHRAEMAEAAKVTAQYNIPQDGPLLASPPLFFASAMPGPVPLPASRHELDGRSASVSPTRRRRGYHPGPLNQPEAIIPFETQVQQPNYFGSSSMLDPRGQPWRLPTQQASAGIETNYGRSRRRPAPAPARSRSPAIIP